ncbi:hypothetical protein N8H71_11170 [Pseudomonas koreensis]|uniref:hypothetical protein n=1 Tax=Pseudomonas koreensis TaxID=198620 RepID=UPI0021C685F9|nr:hypothetical protein [Pseudomonas koreensis]MCU0072158.1 hypothetical protein [Pseudomonas koreensis]
MDQIQQVLAFRQGRHCAQKHYIFTHDLLDFISRDRFRKGLEIFQTLVVAFVFVTVVVALRGHLSAVAMSDDALAVFVQEHNIPLLDAVDVEFPWALKGGRFTCIEHLIVILTAVATIGVQHVEPAAIQSRSDSLLYPLQTKKARR